jgi:hypothetical protein
MEAPVRRRRHRPPDSPQPVEPTSANAPTCCPIENEFDAFLAGTYADWLSTKKQSVPAWAWLNRIAHATISELEIMSTWSAPPSDASDVVLWQRAIALLATDVLAITADDRQLASVQRRVLIPLELRLAERWWSALAPIDFVSVVLSALRAPPVFREQL